jgi:hypothetical protein
MPFEAYQSLAGCPRIFPDACRRVIGLLRTTAFDARAGFVAFYDLDSSVPCEQLNAAGNEM